MLDMADWDCKQVQRWLEGMGLHQYSDHFKHHRITGESLVHIDHEDLEEVGVRSIGHRIRLLTQVNQHLHRGNASLTHHTLEELAQETAELRLRLKKLTEGYNRLRQDMLPAIRRVKETEPLPTPVAASQSPTHPHTRRGASVSPSTDGLSFELNNRTSSRGAGQIAGSAASVASTGGAGGGTLTPGRLGLIEEDSDIGTNTLTSHAQLVHAHVKPGAPISLSTASEPFKSFRVTIDDPCTKVLPAVLKKYRIHDDPAYYRLLVSYGDKERELRNDEKPLHVFRELQESGLRPVFMVRQVGKGSSLTPSGRLTPGGVI